MLGADWKNDGEINDSKIVEDEKDENRNEGRIAALLE